MKKIKRNYIRLIVIYGIAMLYPIYKWVSTDSLVSMSDASLIMGLIVTVFGIIDRIGSLGAFDASIYLLRRNFQSYNKSYEVYLEDVKEKKKGRFNYPLYLGILLILTAVIAGLFC